MAYVYMQLQNNHVLLFLVWLIIQTSFKFVELYVLTLSARSYALLVSMMREEKLVTMVMATQYSLEAAVL